MAQFVVGQRVRLLHESGEGVVTAIIDKKTVEVDTGDDFPVEYDIDEIVAIDRFERLLKPVEDKKEKPEEEKIPIKLGTQLMDLSLAMSKDGDDMEVILANPEKWEMLFVCHIRIKNKYQFFSSGTLKSMGFVVLGKLSPEELSFCKEIHFQFLHFTTGVGLPQSPMEKNFFWSTNMLAKIPVFVEWFQRDAWIFSLRDTQSMPENIVVDKSVEIPSSQFSPTPKKEIKLQKPPLIVDLHIEKLVDTTYGMDNAAMLFTQIQAFEKAISDALKENHKGVIAIHGIGEGRLKSRIIDIAGKHPKVQSYQPADMLKYGGGATELLF